MDYLYNLHQSNAKGMTMNNTIVAVHAVETVTILNEYGDVGTVLAEDNIYEFEGNDLPEDICRELPDGRTLWVSFYWEHSVGLNRHVPVREDDLPF